MTQPDPNANGSQNPEPNSSAQGWLAEMSGLLELVEEEQQQREQREQEEQERLEQEWRTWQEVLQQASDENERLEQAQEQERLDREDSESEQERLDREDSESELRLLNWWLEQEDQEQAQERLWQQERGPSGYVEPSGGEPVASGSNVRLSARGAQRGRVAGRNSYPSDLTDEQWEQIAPWVPDLDPSDRYGGDRRPSYRERDVVNAIRYLHHHERSANERNELPNDFPPEQIVRRYFHEWTHAGPNRSHLDPDSFLKHVLVGLPGRDPGPGHGLTNTDPQPDWLPEEELINQALAEPPDRNPSPRHDLTNTDPSQQWADRVAARRLEREQYRDQNNPSCDLGDNSRGL
jgi:hypothetical protein